MIPATSELEDDFVYGISQESSEPLTEEMREIMRENSRNLEEMLTKTHTC